MDRFSLSKGFSLIETIVAVAIWGILTITSVTMLMNAANMYNKSKEQFNATLIAETYFEQIKISPIESFEEDEINYKDFIVRTKITNVEKYDGKLYKVLIEVLKEDRIIEKFEGYKLDV